MDSDKLWDCLCCCGEDHTIRQGGLHINVVQLKKLAEWPYFCFMNVLVPISKKYPLAAAAVCDKCMDRSKDLSEMKIKYAMAGRPGKDGHAEYYRVPIAELKDPEVYWPNYHPDKLVSPHS